MKTRKSNNKNMNTNDDELIENGSSLGKITFILKNEKTLSKEEYDNMLNNFMRNVSISECELFISIFSIFDSDIIKLLEEKVKKELKLTEKISLLSKRTLRSSFVTELVSEFIESKDKKIIINLLTSADKLPLEEKRRLVDKLGLNIFINKKVKMLLNIEYLDEDEMSSIVDYIIMHGKADIKLLVLRICHGLPVNEIKKLSISIINDYKKDLDVLSILNILIYSNQISINIMKEVINRTYVKELLYNNYDLIEAMLNSELNNENLNIDTLEKLIFLHRYLYGESIQIAKPKRLILKANKKTGE